MSGSFHEWSSHDQARYGALMMAVVAIIMEHRQDARPYVDEYIAGLAIPLWAKTVLRDLADSLLDGGIPPNPGMETVP